MTAQPEATNDLAAFLSVDPKEAIQDEFYLRRLDLTLVIEAIKDADRLEEIREQCVVWTQPKRGPRRRKGIDQSRLNRLVVAEWCVWPPMKPTRGEEGHKTLTDHYGPTEPEDLVGSVFLPGEVVEVAAAIMKLSGFDLGDDDEDGQGN